MNAPRSGAATVRGALVGVCSGAVVVAAHGVGGGGLPSGDALVLLAGAGALVGTFVRTLPAAPAARLAVLTVVLGIGQAAGHLALSVAAGHMHGAGPTSAMVGAHTLAALVCAVLIASAERGHERAVSVLRRIVAALRAVITPPSLARVPRPAEAPRLASSLLTSCGRGTRGPPRGFAAVRAV